MLNPQDFHSQISEESMAAYLVELCSCETQAVVICHQISLGEYLNRHGVNLTIFPDSTTLGAYEHINNQELSKFVKEEI